MNDRIDQVQATSGHELRFGLVIPPMWRSWDQMRSIVRLAEEVGFDAAFVTDHFLSDWDGEGGDVLEAFTMLAALAVETHRIDLGTYVVGATHRNPAVLAKEAVTVDHISGGRLILGLGAAWNRREHAAYGIPFPGAGDRVDRVGETLEILRLLESEQRPSFAGDHATLHDAPFHPLPVRGHIPILVGSRGRRMLRHVARFADYWDLAKSTPEEVRSLSATLAGDCERIGRDPSEIVRMHEQILRADDPSADLDRRVGEFAPLGVSFFLVNAWPKSEVGAIEELAPAIERLRS